MDLLVSTAQQLGLKSQHIPVQNLQIINDRIGWNAEVMDIAYQKIDAFINESKIEGNELTAIKLLSRKLCK